MDQEKEDCVCQGQYLYFRHITRRCVWLFIDFEYQHFTVPK
jgi:hypothetical protein